MVGIGACVRFSALRLADRRFFLPLCFLIHAWTSLSFLWLTDLHDTVEQGGKPGIDIPRVITEELEQLPEAMSPDWYAPFVPEVSTSKLALLILLSLSKVGVISMKAVSVQYCTTETLVGLSSHSHIKNGDQLLQVDTE